MLRRLGLVFAVVGALALWGYLAGGLPKRDQVDSPFVASGTSLNQAKTIIAEAGFKNVRVKTIGDPTSGHCGVDSLSTAGSWKVDRNATITINFACPIRKVPWETYGGTLDEVKADLSKAGFTNIRSTTNRGPGRNTNCHVERVRDSSTAESGLQWTGDLITLDVYCALDP